MSIRVLICDDHEVVREGLHGLIGRQAGMSLVGEAGTVAEAIEAAARTKPDVVVMDVRLPDGSGVEACRSIREARPETKVIMLTSYADDDALFASIIAGASGYLLKQTRGQAVVKVLVGLAEGKTNRDIGETLFLSEKTVKNYVSRILDKLGLSRRAEAAAYVAKHKPRL